MLFLMYLVSILLFAFALWMIPLFPYFISIPVGLGAMMLGVWLIFTALWY
jgi:uncharacterized membrane protein